MPSKDRNTVAPHKCDKAGSKTLREDVVDVLSPPQWPGGIRYLARPVVSPNLTQSQVRWLRRKPEQLSVGESEHQRPPAEASHVIPVINLPLARDDIDEIVEIRKIENEKHHAHGQHGLFAKRDLQPGELILPYVGYVHSSTASERATFDQQQESGDGIRAAQHNITYESNDNEKEDLKSSEVLDAAGGRTTELEPEIGAWDTSSYDLNLCRDEDIELAIDAGHMGNEARFCNDYRGVPTDTIVLGRSNRDWDRLSKRSAKSWTVYEVGADSTRSGHSFSAENVAIPNAEFRDVWFDWPARNGDGNPGMNTVDSKEVRRRKRRQKAGMRGVAICVLPAGKSGKRKHGIKAGQEILVSYGKGFWAHHSSDSVVGTEDATA